MFQHAVIYAKFSFVQGHKDCSLIVDPMGKHVGNPPNNHLNTATILIFEFV